MRLDLSEPEVEAMLTAAACARYVITGDLTAYRALVEGYEGDRMVLVNCAVMLAATGAMVTAEVTGVGSKGSGAGSRPRAATIPANNKIRTP